MNTKAYLGIDVSKGYADFLLLDQDKNVLEEPFQLDDNTSGWATLAQIIDGWLSKGVEDLYCAVESTGGYEDNWFRTLKKMTSSQRIKVARLNPKGVKSVSEAALKRTITDAVSAENIAVYLISFPEKVYYESPNHNEEFKEARQNLSFHKLLVKQHVQLSNQLEKLLYQHFSEMMIYCRNGMPNWLLRLLVKYPSAKQVKRAGEKMLSRIEGISSDKAIGILKKTRNSDQKVSELTKQVIIQTAKEILSKKELCKKQMDFLSDTYKDNEQIKLVNSITGIGVNSAIKIMLEIEDISRFNSAKQLCSYFGVHPVFKESGDGKWGGRMSKKGRSEVRATLFMCALSAIRHDDNLKNLYARFRAKGMNHYQAMGVIMHKMLRIVFGVLKNQQPYDTAIDTQNIENAKQKMEETKALEKKDKLEKRRKSERFKTKDTDAPISRIAAKKRKKQETSQSSTLEENAGSIPAQIKVLNC